MSRAIGKGVLPDHAAGSGALCGSGRVYTASMAHQNWAIRGTFGKETIHCLGLDRVEERTWTINAGHCTAEPDGFRGCCSQMRYTARLCKLQKGSGALLSLSSLPAPWARQKTRALTTAAPSEHETPWTGGGQNGS